MSPYQRSQDRQQRSRQTRDALVAAALKLWTAKGYENTTVKEISDAAGVAWSTFYFHFPNKGDLLTHLVHMTARALTKDTKRLLSAEGNLESRLTGFCEGLRRRIEGVPRDLLMPTLGHRVGHIAFLSGNFNEDDPGISGCLGLIFTRARDDGELAPGWEPREVASIFAATLLEGVLRWVAGSSIHDDLGEVLTYRIRLLFSPLLATGEGRARRASRSAAISAPVG
jgi:AcrR family transcriptional regulator